MSVVFGLDQLPAALQSIVTLRNPVCRSQAEEAGRHISRLTFETRSFNYPDSRQSNANWLSRPSGRLSSDPE